MNNRDQSFPKVVCGLIRYRHTCAPFTSSLISYVARHGGVELNEIEGVNGIAYGRNVVVEPARDFGRAGLYTI